MTAEAMYQTDEYSTSMLSSIANASYRGIGAETEHIANDFRSRAAIWAGAHAGGWLVVPVKDDEEDYDLLDDSEIGDLYNTLNKEYQFGSADYVETEDYIQYTGDYDLNHILDKTNAQSTENFDKWDDFEIDDLYETLVGEYDLEPERREDYLQEVIEDRRFDMSHRIQSGVTASLEEYDVAQMEEKSLTQEYYNMLDEYDAFTSWSDAKEDVDFLRMYWREAKWKQKNRQLEELKDYKAILEEYGDAKLHISNINSPTLAEAAA